MSLGQDLIKAANSLKFEDWPTTTGRNSAKAAITMRKLDAEAAIDELYSAMYGGKFTATQLQQITGQSKDSVYARLATLMERGKVRRTKVKKNYQYYRC